MGNMAYLRKSKEDKFSCMIRRRTTTCEEEERKLPILDFDLEEEKKVFLSSFLMF